MTNETYNGWTNRETCMVNLWVENERSLYDDRQQFLSDWDDERGIGESTRLWFDSIIDAWDEAAEDSPEATRFLLNMLRDIGSLWRVNWHELGESWLRDYDN